MTINIGGKNIPVPDHNPGPVDLHGAQCVLFFDIKAKQRRAIEKAVGSLYQFSDSVWTLTTRNRDRAKRAITQAQRAARCPLKFLVTDEAVFVKGWGVHAGGAAFGGPFSDSQGERV